MDTANQRLVDDLMQAIHGGGGLVVSLERAAKAQEMICAIFEAGLRGTRVVLPLTNRSHPLE